LASRTYDPALSISDHRGCSKLEGLNLNIWKYYHITHGQHIVLNPLLPEKMDRICRLLSPGGRVLDMACGKGELLIRLAELYSVSGIGVDISPYFIEECLEKQRRRVPAADIKFLLMDGAAYKPEAPFDITICLGASFVYGGYSKTLEALRGMTVPGGLIVTGEPFWIKEPEQEYLQATSQNKEDYASGFGGNIAKGEGQGLRCIYSMESSNDDWDHYITLQWKAVHEYSKLKPDDPDLTELVERNGKEKEYYLRWERGVLGWGVYIFRLTE
jgi:SAM-dependent methyltransferase